MCGIVGALPSNEGFVNFALSKQHSRGPDQTTAIDLGWCSLGVNRLAISGLHGGDQPLVSPDGMIVVAFNGAIYNAPELVHQFDLAPPSTNDGEVIPALYQRFGLEFADYLEGMFAICLADMQRREMVIAVDQLGIKPLYHCNQDGCHYVASVMAGFPRELRGSVTRVPPGIAWSSSGEIRRITHRYYRDGSLGDLLRASVREQLPTEVGWGCMLGGIDSTLVTRLAVEASPGCHTFTCGTPDGVDLLAAREIADTLGTTHHEVIVNPEELPKIVDDVVEATASIERPIIRGGVGTYLVARAARATGVKVLLSGDGADELFGGYDELQDVADPFLNSLLLQYQVDLGATECLRLDRGTMAHGVEGRVPYLSTSLIRHARSLGPKAKIRRDGGAQGRKLALREFAATVLPAEIAYRPKYGFSNGSGLRGELRRIAEARFSVRDVASMRAAFPSFPIDDPMSAWFFSRWLDIYGTSIGTDWQSLMNRGLVSQRTSRYLPNAIESASYW